MRIIGPIYFFVGEHDGTILAHNTAIGVPEATYRGDTSYGIGFRRGSLCRDGSPHGLHHEFLFLRLFYYGFYKV